MAWIWVKRGAIARHCAPLSLRLAELLTLVAIAASIPPSLTLSASLFNRVCSYLPLWQPYLSLPSNLDAMLVAMGLPLLAALPWAMDGLLRLQGPGRSLLPTELAEASPTSLPLLQQLFKQHHGVALPKLICLDSPLPLLTSYGHRPRNFCLVVSQGLLDRLTGEQIAALLAGELGHLQNQAVVILPWLNLLPQLPLGIYALLSRLGNHCQEKLKQPLDIGFRFLYRSGLVLSGLGGAIAYGLFKLWRWPLLWLARGRSRAGDRAGVNLLQDPNAYSRALLAYGQALSDAVATAEQTPILLEALELVLPLGLPDALTASFAPAALTREQRFVWDSTSPYRHWLGLNNSHPPLGDRLARLAQYAQRSQTPPEVKLTFQSTHQLNPLGSWSAFKHRRWEAARQSLNASFATLKPLLLQGFPFYGAGLGLLLGFGLWALGGTASLFGIWRLDWVYGDLAILQGCIPIGIGLGLIVRTNAFFPKRSRRETSPAAGISLLSDPLKLPLAAEPVEFRGRLVGRPGLANWLGQDLLLLSEQGPLRLHWCSPLGPAGNLWPKFLRPSFLLGREVVVSGWLRRGATLWLDVEQICTVSGGKSSQRGHPMWAAVMAAIALLWGVVILLPNR
ncbi:MAG: M48 family metalloprotease [Synechococcales cyanobacterium RM1_1_8]|nr:M48 family metalloprotease [Synechococcales cyanobacterium RM1_1_8]